MKILRTDFNTELKWRLVQFSRKNLYFWKIFSFQFKIGKTNGKYDTIQLKVIINTNNMNHFLVTEKKSKLLGQFRSNNNEKQIVMTSYFHCGWILVNQLLYYYKLTLQCKADIGLIFLTIVIVTHPVTRIEWNEHKTQKCKLNCGSAISFIIILMIDMSMGLWFKFKVIQFEKKLYQQCKIYVG